MNMQPPSPTKWTDPKITKFPCFSEFPEVVIPAWLTTQGWTDASSRSLPLPLSEYYTPGERRFPLIMVWVNPDPKFNRYSVLGFQSEAEFYDPARAHRLYQGDDEADAQAQVIAHIGRYLEAQVVHNPNYQPALDPDAVHDRSDYYYTVLVKRAIQLDAAHPMDSRTMARWVAAYGLDVLLCGPYTSFFDALTQAEYYNED
jgi:hypothetical protein